jgi:hypothetical protein
MFIFMEFGSHREERGFVTFNGFFMSSKDPLNFLGLPIVYGCVAQKRIMLPGPDKGLKRLKLLHK